MSGTDGPRGDATPGRPGRRVRVDGGHVGAPYTLAIGSDGTPFAASGQELWVFGRPGEGGPWRVDWQALLNGGRPQGTA